MHMHQEDGFFYWFVSNALERLNCKFTIGKAEKETIMKKLTALILAFVLAFTFTACSQNSQGSSAKAANRLEEIKQRGYITVATEPYFAPNEFIDPSKTGDEQYVGADVELAKYIADKLGVELKLVPLEFTAVLSSVTEGKYDLAISALAYKPDRAESMNLSKGYYFGDDTDGYGVLVRTEDADKYATAESMKDAVIVVQSGSLQEAFVTQQIPQYKELKRVASMNDAFLMVQEGKADMAACFIGNGTIYSQANQEVCIANGFKFTEDKETAGTRIGMMKGEDELTEAINSIIDEVVDSGAYAKWYREYKEYAKTLGI